MNAVKKLAVRVSYKCREFWEYRAARRDMRALAEKVRADGPVRVVFIAQYVPAWNKVKGLYEELRRRENTEAYILCVPSGIRGGRLLDEGDLSNDTYDYFIGQGYEAINALVGKNQWFDLQSLQPDYVFHPRPYNDFMPPVYQSSQVRKYAKLCNIMYGPALTYNGLKTTLNRDYHKDLCKYFATTTVEADYWNDRFSGGVRQGLQKAYAIGNPVFEELAACRGGEDVQRTTFLWSPRWTTDPAAGGTNFFTYRQVLNRYAAGHPDAELIVRPHPLMFRTLVEKGDMTQQEADDYRQQLQQLPNARLDEAKEYTKMLWQTTALISDISFLVVEYFTTGKPVIYCPPAQPFPNLPWVDRMLEGCYIVHNEEELVQAMEQLARGEDPLCQRRQQLIEELFGGVAGSASRIADVLVQDAGGRKG